MFLKSLQEMILFMMSVQHTKLMNCVLTVFGINNNSFSTLIAPGTGFVLGSQVTQCYCPVDVLRTMNVVNLSFLCFLQKDLSLVLVHCFGIFIDAFFVTKLNCSLCFCLYSLH